MKKLLSLVLATMMLGLVGCGAADETVENSANELAAGQEDSVEEESSVEESNVSEEADAEADSEESMEETVAVDEPLVLVKQITNENA